MEIVNKASCPNCGAELPLGRAGGRVRCAYCETAFSYVAPPARPGRPAPLDELQQITGVPIHNKDRVLFVGWHQRKLEDQDRSELVAYDSLRGQTQWHVQADRSERLISTLPSGKSTNLGQPIIQLRVVAGTVIAVTATELAGHTRSLRQRWTHPLVGSAGSTWPTTAGCWSAPCSAQNSSG